MIPPTEQAPLTDNDRRHLKEVSALLGVDRDGGLAPLKRKMRSAGGATWVQRIPLDPAVLSQSLGCLQFLIDEMKVKTVNMPGPRGDWDRRYTPVRQAVIWGRTEILVYLLARGADPMLKTENSVLDQARLRQSRLQDALDQSEDGAELGEGVRIEAKDIRRIFDEGNEMLQILEGVDACGSYQAWAAASGGSHPLVKKFSCDDDSASCRYEFTVLRALVLSERATLRAAEERAAVLAQAAARAAVKAREERPLNEALQELGFSEHGAKMVASKWKLAHTVGLLRTHKPTAEEVEVKLEPLVRSGVITEGEQRRFAKWVRELDEVPAEPAPVKAAPKAKAKAKAKAQNAALLAMASKGKGRGGAAKTTVPVATSAKKRKDIDPLAMLFDNALPDNAFMLVACFAFGRPSEPASDTL